MRVDPDSRAPKPLLTEIAKSLMKLEPGFGEVNCGTAMASAKICANSHMHEAMTDAAGVPAISEPNHPEDGAVSESWGMS